MRLLRQLSRRKLRTAVTITGITIGVWALVVFSSMANKINDLVGQGAETGWTPKTGAVRSVRSRLVRTPAPCGRSRVASKRRASPASTGWSAWAHRSSTRSRMGASSRPSSASPCSRPPEASASLPGATWLFSRFWTTLAPASRNS
jgi:hypothetical protein